MEKPFGLRKKKYKLYWLNNDLTSKTRKSFSLERPS